MLPSGGDVGSVSRCCKSIRASARVLVVFEEGGLAKLIFDFGGRIVVRVRVVRVGAVFAGVVRVGVLGVGVSRYMSLILATLGLAIWPLMGASA